MSAKATGAVWEMDLPREQKYVLLALADHADHDGRKVYPSLELVAWKTAYSVRQVRRIMRELEDAGVLVLDGNRTVGRGQTVHYRIDLSAAPKLPPREEKGGQNVRLSDEKGGHLRQQKADISDQKADTAVSAEPSLEPSGEPSRSSPTSKTGPRPFDFLAALCEDIGTDVAGLSDGVKKRQLAVAKRLIADGMTEDELRRCVGWLRSQTWITGAIDLFLVEKKRGEWELAGKPAPTTTSGDRTDGERRDAGWWDRGGQGRVVL